MIYCNEKEFDISYANLIITPADVIVKTVCDYFEISIEDIKGKSRKRTFSDARAIAMFLIMETTDNSTYEKTGKMFSGRDHSTVIFNYKKVEDLVDSNKKFKAHFEAVSLLVTINNTPINEII